MREVTARILRANGYQVMEAGSADEAMALAGEFAYELLLTDVVMPGGSGRDLAWALQHARPDLAVLLMSGYSRGVLGVHRPLDDDLALIQKPFTTHQLLVRVHGALAPAGPDAPADPVRPDLQR
ncbi:MAG: response regulator [Actinomycetota bacterium]|nr:response regulator [Actinomycetota bacterium]